MADADRKGSWARSTPGATCRKKETPMRFSCSSRSQLHRLLKACAVVVILAAGLVAAGGARAGEDVETLLDTDQTIMGQPLSYPIEKPAKVKAQIITLKPGDERGW